MKAGLSEKITRRMDCRGPPETLCEGGKKRLWGAIG